MTSLLDASASCTFETRTKGKTLEGKVKGSATVIIALNAVPVHPRGRDRCVIRGRGGIETSAMCMHGLAHEHESLKSQGRMAATRTDRSIASTRTLVVSRQ